MKRKRGKRKQRRKGLMQREAGENKEGGREYNEGVSKRRVKRVKREEGIEKSEAKGENRVKREVG